MLSFIRRLGRAPAIPGQARFFADGIGFESSLAVHDLRDKTILVTGSTAGIGLHTSQLLAQHGATVLIHGRNTQKVKKTIRTIRMHSGNEKVYGYVADFASLRSVHQFASSIRGDVAKFFNNRLHCLVNNAGVFMEDREETEDGLEMTWAVNTAAPFLLTADLLPIISERIINVSSISLADSIDFSNTQQELGYERLGHAAYGISKLALNMWSYALADKLVQAGSEVVVNTVDPGTVSTKLLYAGWGEISHVALKAEEADDEFWGVADPEVGRVTGKYYVNRKARLSPGVSYDKEMQERLWQLLEEQTGAHYTIPPGTP